MPKRTDIHKILVIGSGPIVIGQACEFDYSGAQALKALRDEGYDVVLINSNPATIMTDPDFAPRTYVEPILPDVVAKIIERERPDAILPTVGGQTALNTAVALADGGVLEQFHVELIGANIDAIKKAEDRELFKDAMTNIGLEVPQSGFATTVDEARALLDTVGLPAIIRPSFTLGGTGGNVAYNRDEYEEYIEWGLKASPQSQILIEESALGWKEFELEVMRDHADNVVIICSIENLDPMGIHTGDSITVAPAQTLTDKEYQLMRDAALAIIREIGVDTGGSNIQFALDPATGRMIVIEMNPRVSRSSALASKATGFPIAKIAAKLAVGYTLDEIPNDITRETPASFEPTIDYVVTKIPRFTFEKFPQAKDILTTQMKSVGEAMSIGRTFKESLQKALRSLETGRTGLNEIIMPSMNGGSADADREKLKDIVRSRLAHPTADRLFYIADAFRLGLDIDDIHALTAIDPWFLGHIRDIVEFERECTTATLSTDGALLRTAKEWGMSDARLGELTGAGEEAVRGWRRAAGIAPVYKRVDTCAAEFEAHTPYLYSTYEHENEARPTAKRKIMILGGGPNRIGQGIEFDYCCVHAAFALAEAGCETIMVNCNPETVSTDYDTSDRLYFEPLTFEDVLAIVEEEKPDGVIVQFGGQTPLKLAVPLEKAGVPILGTTPDSIDRAEDRERFQELLTSLGLKQPANGLARTTVEAARIAEDIGYPVLVRPSYVLGGRAMEIVFDETALLEYMARAVKVSPDHPVLIDKFLSDAIEIDVDAIADGDAVVVAGVMEHIEEAGVHSGDSACALPPYSLTQDTINEIMRQTKALAKALDVVGLMNVQFAYKGGDVFVIEVNPRASRTAPFVSKAIGVPIAKLAARVMAGEKLAALGFTTEIVPAHVSVKEAVFPFVKFPGVDPLLGPEMKSTGEVMGLAPDFGTAFLKAQLAASVELPESGTAFLSTRDDDKDIVVEVGRGLIDLGFTLIATRGTADYLAAHGVRAETVNKVHEGRPHIVDRMVNGDVALVINTPGGGQSIADSYSIRRTALMEQIPYCTTVAGARAMVAAIRALHAGPLAVQCLQEYHTSVSAA